MNKKIKILLFISFVFINSRSYSIVRHLYLMNALPQINLQNPGFIPEYKFHIGLGVNAEAGILGLQLSSISSKINENGLKSAFINISKAGTLLFGNDLRTYADANADILHFGFTNRLGYFSFYLGLRAIVDARIPKELFDFATNGNKTNTVYEVAPLVNVNSYLKLGLGFTHDFSNRLTIGGRLNFYFSPANANTLDSKITVQTSNTNQTTVTYNINSNINGLVGKFLKGNSITIDDISNSLFSGFGFGLDLGAEYRFTEYFSVNAALLDMGAIFNPQTQSLNFNLQRSATLKNIANITSISNVEINGTDNLSNFFDTLTKPFNQIADYLKNGVENASTLPYQINVGTRLMPTNGTILSAHYLAQLFGVNLSHSFTLGINQRIIRGFNMSLSYSYAFRRFDNIGFGTDFRFGPFQINFAMDNLIGLINYASNISNLISKGVPATVLAVSEVNGFNINFGINFVFIDRKAIKEQKMRNMIGRATCLEPDEAKNKKISKYKEILIEKSKKMDKKSVRDPSRIYIP